MTCRRCDDVRVLHLKNAGSDEALVAARSFLEFLLLAQALADEYVAQQAAKAAPQAA